jgi:hypothetical protein
MAILPITPLEISNKDTSKIYELSQIYTYKINTTLIFGVFDFVEPDDAYYHDLDNKYLIHLRAIDQALVGFRHAGWHIEKSHSTFKSDEGRITYTFSVK